MNRFGLAGALPLFFIAFSHGASAQCTNGLYAVVTGQYDNLRDSVNPNETCLKPDASTFYGPDGKTPIFIQQAQFPTILTSTGAESPIYGQPLYVPNVPIGGGRHNVVYVTALNDVVYAYDADNYGSGSPPSGVLYWSTALANNCSETVSGKNYPGALITLPVGGKLPYIGILSTPAIDAAAGLMYVVNACNVTGPTNHGMQWYLSVLKLGNGTNFVPPVIIAGGVTNAFGSTPFTPTWELQRPALLLTKDSVGADEVYIAFGAGTTEGPTQKPYHGWLFGYTLNSTSTALVQQSVFTTTPEASAYSTMCNSVISDGYPLPPNWCGESGGIWMSGRGPAAMTVGGKTNIVLAVSNGGFQTQDPVNWGESVLKFTAGDASVPTDSFTPSGWYLDENENDEDMGTSGVIMFQGTVNGIASTFVVVLDKAGNLFLLSQPFLGGFNTPDKAIQEFLATSSTPCQQTNVADSYCNEPHSLVYWNNTLYMWPMQSPIRSYAFSNGVFRTTPIVGAVGQGFPGGILALSANGTTNGILWALHSPSTSRLQREPGALSAFNTSTLANIWTSTDPMLLSTFAEPLVVNGRVYVPTWDHGLLVYANH